MGMRSVFRKRRAPMGPPPTHTQLCDPPYPPHPPELCPLRSHFATLELNSALSAAPGQPNPKRCCGPSAAVGSHPIPGLRSAPHPHPVFSRLPLPVSAVRCAALTAAQQLLQAADRDGSARTDGGERLRCPHSRPSAPPLCPELCRAAQRRARSASGFAHGPKKAFPALSPTRSSWQPRPRPAPRATSACVRQTPALKCSEGPTWARRINAGTPPPPPSPNPTPFPSWGAQRPNAVNSGFCGTPGWVLGSLLLSPPSHPPRVGVCPSSQLSSRTLRGGERTAPLLLWDEGFLLCPPPRPLRCLKPLCAPPTPPSFGPELPVVSLPAPIPFGSPFIWRRQRDPSALTINNGRSQEKKDPPTPPRKKKYA